MCGINLIIDRIGELNAAPVLAMNKATQHRGPDNSAQSLIDTFEPVKIWLAASRLAISERNNGADQPMYSSDGRYQLMFNGEIYNHFELKNELLKTGHSFRSASDTEVLMYWLIAKGWEGLKDLHGMFALVLADKQTGNLLLARDKAGMKPLYYHHGKNCFVASSEIRGILASGQIPAKLQEDQIVNYLTWRYAEKPYTLYNGIKELESGQAMLLNTALDIETHSIASEKIIVNGIGKSENNYKELITDSLLRHLYADAPTGLFLSGGVDSTLLLAIAAREGYSMPVYSLVNSKKDADYGTDDYKYARKAVDMFGGLHHIYELTEDCINQFDDFIDSIDQPIADGGAFCTYLLCQHASKDVKVILSGAGADELFAGYNRHQAFHFYLKNHSWMRRILPLLKTVGKALPTGISHPWRKQCRLVAKFTNDLHKDPETTYDHFRSLGTKNLYRDQGSFGVQKNSSAASYDEWFQHALLTDRQSYLVSDLLAMSDVMSMRWGLEMRMPYLDENIYEAIRSENAGYLIQKGKKWILKELLTTYGGKIFAQRSKSGFGLPLGEWLRNGPWRDLLSIIEKPDARIYQYLDFASTQLIIRQHIKRQADKSQEIWALIVLEKWLLKKGF